MAKKTTTTAAPEDPHAKVAELVARAQELIHETVESLALEQGNECFAFQLISDASHLLANNSSALASGDDVMIIISAQSMLMGARDMKDVTRALPAMLEPAITALEQASEIVSIMPQSAGSTQPPAAPPIASPAPDAQAGGTFSSVQEIGQELWTVRALVNSLHDSLDFDEHNSERRVLRVIDERLAAIHQTM